MSKFTSLEELYIHYLMEEMHLLKDINFAWEVDPIILEAIALTSFQRDQMREHIYDQFEYAIDGLNCSVACRLEAKRRYDIEYGVLS